MAKLIAVLLLLGVACPVFRCEVAHQSVARLKRDVRFASRPQLFDTQQQQQQIDQIPDEEQQQQQQQQQDPQELETEPPQQATTTTTTTSSSTTESSAGSEDYPYNMSPDGSEISEQIIKDTPANRTRAQMRDITVTNCGNGPNVMKNLNRIVNGTRSGPGMFPWQVYLRISTNQGEMLCGGSILNENWVLTAAHCISSEQDGHYTATAIEVVAGALDRFNQESSKQKSYADCAFKHPNWRGIRSNFANDIALIRMPRMSGFKINGNTVNGICLPPKTNPRFTYAGPAIVSGWGLTTNRGSTSRTLQYTKVSLLTHQQCLRFQYPVPIIDSMVCQGLDHSAPCQGDSGGPLAIFRGGKWVQYGLVSFGPGICNNGKIPNAVYTQLSAHMTWLENTISSYNVNPTCSPRRIAIS